MCPRSNQGTVTSAVVLLSRVFSSHGVNADGLCGQALLGILVIVSINAFGQELLNLYAVHLVTNST